ncbi:MAG: hypothetical protein ACFFD2_00515 [Promethearchaeota archaeon]
MQAPHAGDESCAKSIALRSIIENISTFFDKSWGGYLYIAVLAADTAISSGINSLCGVSH